MDHYLTEPPTERLKLLAEAEERLGLPQASIEKDYWVCWMLRVLFELPEWGSRLTFKGGTARRTRHPGRRRRLWLGELRAACQETIRDSLQPALTDAMNGLLPVDLPWALEADIEDPNGQTLLFTYPVAGVENSQYLTPVVRLEMGARSDTEPGEAPTVQSYLAEAFPDLFPSRDSTLELSHHAAHSGKRRCSFTKRPFALRRNPARLAWRATTTISGVLFRGASPRKR